MLIIVSTYLQDVMQNIRGNSPVILTGCREGISIFDWTYSGCHAWVCHGYNGWQDDCSRYIYYHMNWGWNGRFNGWFANGDWAPGDLDYQYVMEVLLSINPN